MWLRCDWARLNRPLAVLRNRFAAPRLVFILGITYSIAGLTRTEDHPRPKQAGWKRGRPLLNSLFLWRHHHDELSSFHFRKLLNGAVLFEILLDSLQQLDAKLLMRHLAATKPQRHFRLVAGRQKTNQIPQFDFVVTDLRAWTKFHFLEMGLSLLTFTNIYLFLLLKKIFAEIHYPAYRWTRVRGNFDQVQVFGPGQLNRTARAHDTGLFTRRINDPYVRNLDLLVPSNPLFSSDTLILHNIKAAAHEFGLQALGEVIN